MDRAATGVRMAVDLTVQMINATVQIDQPLGNGTRTVGTGFLVQAPTPDGEDGLKALLLADAATQSAKTGQVVKLALAD